MGDNRDNSADSRVHGRSDDPGGAGAYLADDLASARSSPWSGRWQAAPRSLHRRRATFDGIPRAGAR